MQDKSTVLYAPQQLEQYRKNLAAGLFEAVIQQSNQVLAENETEPPADVALYVLGEVYVHHDYPGKDYALSQYYFQKLIDNFPNSPLTSGAKTYISLLEAIATREKALSAVKEKLAFASEPRKIIENQNFEKAAQENLQILQKAGRNKPADEALYNLGLIYAHVENPAKDYKKSQVYFHTLIKQYPDSQLTEEAQIWLGLFETIEKIQQIDIDIEQQKKQLTR